LFTSTRFAAAKAVRGERRRAVREQTAATMDTEATDGRTEPLDWDRAVAPCQPIRQRRVAVDTGQRVLQVVGDGGEELVAQDRVVADLFGSGGLPLLMLVGLQFKGDQVCQELERLKDIVGQVCRFGIEGTEHPKLFAVAAQQRDGDIALDAVERPGRVIREARILTGVIDEQRRDRAADDVSKRRRHVQGIAWPKSEPNIVEDGARRPRVWGHAGDECDPQASRATQDFERGLDRVETVDRVDVRLVGRHQGHVR